MDGLGRIEAEGTDLTDRERQVLEAVVRTYVDTAEPAGSRTLSRTFDLGVSAATVRNTMSDLEEKGYLFHPHASAGRVPTDRAYRVFVEELMQPISLSKEERDRLASELDPGGISAVEALVRRATRALGLLSRELGVAAGPRLSAAVLERLDLVKVSSTKVLMVVHVRSGMVRTVFVDLTSEVPEGTLATLTLLLNERLSGLSLQEIRDTVALRVRDVDDAVRLQIGRRACTLARGDELFEHAAGQGLVLEAADRAVAVEEADGGVHWDPQCFVVVT